MEAIEQITKKLIVLFFLSIVLFAGPRRTFTGVITDTMCGLNHAVMGKVRDPDCVRACSKPGSKWRYALHDGKRAYVLSDQQTPEKFAGKRVSIAGVLFEKTGILQVESIAGR